MNINELPEEGELILATVKEVTPHGAYVTLDEYNDMTGFLHISEVATGWVRSIERFTKEGQKVVLKVIRVNKNRREVDLSLKQVTDEEKRKKLMMIKREEKAKVYFESIKSKYNYSDEEMREYIRRIRDEYGLLDIFEEVAKNNKVLTKIDIPKEMKDAILEIGKSIKLPVVEVRGIMEITCMKSDGMDIIKKILTSTENDDIDIIYLGAPRYRISVKAENFKIAEKILTKAISNIQGMIVKYGGTFNFTREESKKGVT